MILLLHIPNFKSKEKENTRINILPAGMIALSNYLSNNEYQNNILHLGIENKINPKFDIIKYIKDNQIDIIFCDLHWYYQTYSLFNILKEIKKSKKNIKIILGGLTATLFSKQILKDIKYIDFIIKGNSELPSKLLLDKFNGKNISFNEIPNLCWREKNIIIENPIGYEYSSDTEVNYSSVDNILHNKIYLNNLSYDFHKNINGFYYPIHVQYGPCDKGCYSCPGNNFALKTFFKDCKKKEWFDENIILKNIKILKKQGIDKVYFMIYDFDKIINVLKIIKHEYPEIKILIETCTIFDNKTLDDIDAIRFKNNIDINCYIFHKESEDNFIDKLKNILNKRYNLNYHILFTLGEHNSKKKYYEKILEFVKKYKMFRDNIAFYYYLPDPMTEHSITSEIFNDISKIYDYLNKNSSVIHWKNSDEDIKKLINKIEDELRTT